MPKVLIALLIVYELMVHGSGSQSWDPKKQSRWSTGNNLWLSGPEIIHFASSQGGKNLVTHWPWARVLTGFYVVSSGENYA